MRSDAKISGFSGLQAATVLCVIGIAVLLQGGALAQSIAAEGGAAGPVGVLFRFGWIAALAVAWGATFPDLPERLLRKEAGALVLIGWLAFVILAGEALFRVADPISAAAMVLQWGGWVGIALAVYLRLSGRAAANLLLWLTASVGLIALVPIVAETVFGVVLLKTPATFSGVSRHYGFNFSIALNGFQIAIGALAAAALARLESPGWKQNVAIVIFGLLVLGLPLTTSRSAVWYFLIAFGLAMTICGAQRRRFWPEAGVFVATAGAICAVSAALGPEFWAFLTGAFDLTDPGNMARVGLMSGGVDYGSDPSNWPPPMTLMEFIQQVSLAAQSEYTNESSIVRFYHQAGIPGVFALTAFGLLVFWLILTKAPKPLMPFLLALGMVFSGFSITFDVLKSWVGLFYLFLFVGTVLALSSSDQSPTTA